MTKQDLDIILEKHRLWLNGEKNGERADLSGADLRGIDLYDTNLYFINFSGADLSYADLSSTNLRNADLSYADLCHVNFRGADLRGAILLGAKTENVKYNSETSFYALQCPETGSFTAFKKCRDKVVELIIPKSAKRSSATSRKCRANKAKVIAIYNLDKTVSDLKKIASNRDKSFIYEIGKTVIVKNFDENRWMECSTGIHFFLTFDEAKQY